MTTKVPGSQNVDITDLLLWDCNPRMLRPLNGQSQLVIAQAMNDEFDPIEVGNSVAATGWDATSVLSVTDEGMPAGKYLVVEGNRRLTALLALSDPNIRSNLSNAEDWAKAASQASEKDRLPASVPCVVYSTLKEAKLQLGPRHFLGIKQWEPYQKDRFILENIDAGDPIVEVSASFGFDVVEVRKSVLVFRVFEALARSSYGRLLERNYGNLRELILKYGAIRAHMMLPEGRTVDESFTGFDEDSAPAIAEILTWVFGTSPDKSEDVDDGRKVMETREYRILNRIVQSVRGLEALRDPGTTLTEAYDIVLAENSDPSAEFEKNAKLLIDALVRLREIYRDEGPDVVSEVSKRYLAEAVDLVGQIDSKTREVDLADENDGLPKAGSAVASIGSSSAGTSWSVWLGDWLDS
jgi:hypothetical protein